ncbi:S1 family peptidase [Cellulomonas wangsupingiae]|uniref:S1 family peptidase n=1 Tax=Cellulomonas wangsupingiae TaxID=2968085 RepID=A0ABY5K5X4_9CELL|nr:S1 family peptidase [Cellulomonas wangsupingiae]MCC2335389.1 S1 family peptidase [Cellulomonas wangsupingiae]UUI64435.1 S1 family peptidase [Cellulomonas wangsupingiae]
MTTSAVRTRRAATVALAALALLVGPLAAGGGASAAAPAGDVPEGMVDALERDLGVPRAEAVQRLSFQADAATRVRTLTQALGTSYAGAWVDPAAGTVHVATTTPSKVRGPMAAGVTTVTVDRSLAQLEQLGATLDAAGLPATVATWYVDVPTNKLVVEAVGGTGAAAELVAAAGLPADAVTLAAAPEAPRTFIDVIGGNAYYISSRTRCSVGFAVQGGFVTAGHCGAVGAPTTSPTGTFRGSSFPGNDYGWVQVAAGNTPRGLVNNYSGGTVRVTGSQQAAVGAYVCRSGSTTGWRCGTVQAYGSTVRYSQGTVSGLIRTTVCAEPGDSGGSLLAGTQAQGVTSGGSGNCRTGGTTYFQPVGEILQAYGLRLVTS